MSEKKSSSNLKKEEIRGLFVLGLLAVLASIKVQSDKIMVTIGQITIDIIPMLDITIILWSFYAMFMVFGLSEDMLGKTVANIFRETAKMFLSFNFIVLAFLSLMLGFFAFPNRLPWALGLISLLLLYVVFEKSKELIKFRRSRKSLKTSFKKWGESNLRFFSALLILICFAVIMFGSDEGYVFPSFVIGCVGVVIFIIAVRREKTKDSTNKEYA